MFRKVLFSAMVLLLAYSLWFRPDILTITAGISIFLFGMLCLEQGFRQVSGGLLALTLNRTTRTPWSSYGAGVLATGLLQSSSLISVLALSFVSTRLISLGAGIALLMGSGLGSTVGTWLIAGLGMKVAISHYAMPLLVMGTLLQLQKVHRLQGGGYALLGLGFLLLGIHYIKEGMAGVGDTALLSFNYGLITGVLAGTLLTILMQSSHALLILVMTAMAGGHIDYANAVALCIGTNIGTTATAALAAITATADGRRLALANIIYKLTAGFFIMVTLPFWLSLCQGIASVLGITGNTMLELALFHSIFNLVGSILMVPFLNPLQDRLKRLFVSEDEHKLLDIPLPADEPLRAQLLNPAVLQHPDAALEALRSESTNLYRQTIALISFGLYVDNSLNHDNDLSMPDSIPPWPNWRVGKLYKLKMRGIHEDICNFCDELETQVGPEQKADIIALRMACNNFAGAIKQLRYLHKSLRRSVHSDTAIIREHYRLVRNRIITTIKQIREISKEENCDIATAISALKRELYTQDFLSENSLKTLLKETPADALHITALINDNGTAHNICNNLIDGAVILLLQGHGAVITPGTGKELAIPVLSDNKPQPSR